MRQCSCSDRRDGGVPDRPGEDAHAEPARVAGGRVAHVQAQLRLLPEGAALRGLHGPLPGPRAAAGGRRAREGHQAHGERPPQGPDHRCARPHLLGGRGARRRLRGRLAGHLHQPARDRQDPPAGGRRGGRRAAAVRASRRTWARLPRSLQGIPY